MLWIYIVITISFSSNISMPRAIPAQGTTITISATAPSFLLAKSTSSRQLKRLVISLFPSLFLPCHHRRPAASQHAVPSDPIVSRLSFISECRHRQYYKGLHNQTSGEEKRQPRSLFYCWCWFCCCCPQREEIILLVVCTFDRSSIYEPLEQKHSRQMSIYLWCGTMIKSADYLASEKTTTISIRHTSC